MDDSDDSEVWAEIPGFDGFYESSTIGRVRTAKTIGRFGPGRILRQYQDSSGYLQVVLRVPNGDRRMFLVHRMVMFSFVGVRERDVQVNHKDGVKTNNHLGNLEYVDQSENMLHAVRLGLLPTDHLQGTKHPLHKLSEDEAREIIRLRGMVTQRELAKRYGVTQALISNIHRGMTWKHLKPSEN